MIEQYQKNQIGEYTLSQYKQHYQELMQFSTIVDNKNKNRICEKIELICEYSVWGDQNNSDFFDYFFEENIAENLFKLMQRSGFKEITIGIIQCFGILLANLTNKENVNYLLSHSVMQDLIMYLYDFTDEEIVDYYISFLKSLALRIDESNLQLFFNQRMSIFPLLWQATKFYNHKEIMVRTAVRTIILGIMKIQNPLLKQYLRRFPFVTFYAHFACYLKNIWVETNKEILSGNIDVKEKIDDLVDIFYFLNDMYAFCPEIADILDNSLLSYTIIPTMFGGILFQKKETISIPLTLHLSNNMINNFSTSQLSKSIILLMFSPQIQSKLNHLLEYNIKLPRSFMYGWSFRNFWDDHKETLFSKANELFNIQSYSISDETNDCNDEIQLLDDALGLSNNNGATFFCKQLLSNNGQELLVENKIRKSLMMYLQTKDDNFLYLLFNSLKTALNFPDKDTLRTCLFMDANTQQIVNERNKIIQILLNIFTIDPPLRLCTLILSIQIIIHLFQIDKLVLEQETKEKLYEIQYYISSKMNSMLKQKQYLDVIVSQYQTEYQKFSINIKQLKPNLDYLSFYPIIDKYDNTIDFINRQPQGLREIAIRDLDIFIMVDTIFTQMLNVNSQNANSQLQFSESITNEWKVGQNYEPPNNSTLLSCKISAKTFKDKLQTCTSGECFWMQDEDNFIVMETQIVKKQWAHILYFSKIKDVEAIIDRAEPRKLNVNIKVSSFNTIKEQYIDVQLMFDDYTYSQQAKKHIDEMRKENSKKAATFIENKIQCALAVCTDHFHPQNNNKNSE